MTISELKTLGEARAQYKGLETFEAPAGMREVMLISDECVAVCPVTGQPDWYTVEVFYRPTTLCVESKTFKLFIQSFKESGMFCEAFASRIAFTLAALLETPVRVPVTQKPSGGVKIVARAKGYLP